MGQEEVSVIVKSFEDNGNLFSNENREKDIHRSRKEIIMKTNGKKRVFALLMCVMMIISSMSVWAAYASATIGSTSSDRALCELSLTSTSGRAYTTPDSVATTVSTTIDVTCKDAGTPGYASGTSSAIVSVRRAAAAYSTHQAGPYHKSLNVILWVFSIL